MNRGRKFLASILTILLIVQILPASLVTFALEAKMEQKNNNVVEHITKVPVGYTGIYTKDDLNNVRKNLAGKYIMMNDIEFSQADFAEGGAFYNDGQGWSPIGTDDKNAFTGIFDGNGYVVKKLYINIAAPVVCMGLFGFNQGAIQNLGMVDGSVSASSSVMNAFAGGIVGYNDGTISNCYNTGTVSASSYSSTYAGGIAGYNCKTISNCYNTGKVYSYSPSSSSPSPSNAGGIVGGNSGAIINCYNIGSVSATSTSSSFAANAGGIIGIAVEKNTMTNCYYIDSITKGSGKGTDTATKLTLEQMKQQSSFVGFDFEKVWQISGETTYSLPTLKSTLHIEKEENTTHFAGGNGAIYNPFKISNKEQLNNVKSYLEHSFILINDIEFTSSDFAEGGSFYSAGQGWTPIGIDEKNAFTGIFDGNGYTVKNLYINRTSNLDVYAGLFGYNKGTIKNLGIVDGSVSASPSSSSAYAGGIAGCNSSGTITNSYNTGSVSSSSSSSAYAGGIAGDNGGTISGCYNTGSVSTTTSSSSNYAGGIAGYHYSGTISVCYNIGSVSALSSYGYAGGIAGYHYDRGTISGCYNTGSVSALSSYGDAGGIAGANGGTITNSYNTGSVSASSYAGGIAGGNSGTITNCYNTGSMNSSFNRAGGIVGQNNRGTITNCYCLDIVSKGVGDETDTATKLTLEQMKQQSSFVGFDFEKVWQISAETTYLLPTLKSTFHIEKEENTTDFAGGNGATYNPFKISNKEQLDNVKNYLEHSFILINDIEFTDSDFVEGGAFYNGGKGWAPIGTDDENAFTGIFDGNGYTVKNLYINITSEGNAYAGAFGCNKGTIKNLGMVDGSVSASPLVTSIYSYVAAGGVVGRNYGTISGCYNTGRVSASSSSAYVGGIAGENGDTITNSYNTGSVSCSSSYSSAFAGGIAGGNGGTISGCYNTGSVYVASYVGGIAGENTGTITNCYSTGSVCASSYAGGIAGRNSGAITNSYNTGSVSALSSEFYAYAGGIVGDNNRSIMNCYYLDVISKGVGLGTNNATKLTLDQMMQQSSFGGFDFDSVWEMHPKRLPNLKVFGINDLQSINFANKSVELGLNGQYNTKVSSIPTNASFIIAEYTSQNPLVATVDSNGVITGKSLGTTNIIVRDILTGKTAICTVTIVQGVTSILISGSNEVDIGAKTQLTATVLPNDAVNKTLKWSSSDTRIATVDQNGLVTGVGVGTVTITATATDGTEVKGTYSVKVIKHAEYIVLDKTEIGLKNGETQKLTATIYPIDTSDQKVLWTSSDTSVATVDSNGNVTAKGRGVATITAKTNDGGYEATCTVTVTQPVVSVSLNKTDLLLGTNKTYQLTATINPSNANNQNVRWESGDTTIATVDKNGFVYGVAEGTTTITVITEDGNKVAVCIVTVSSKEPDPIKLGDLTGDGIVDAADAILILRADAGLITLTEEQKKAADVTKDGIIDSADAIKIARYDAQLITEL